VQAQVEMKNLPANGPSIPLQFNDVESDLKGVMSIDTSYVGEQFFPAAELNGVVVIELCGGMCAGLDMVLRQGIKVVGYHYCDIDPNVRAVAKHRVRQLMSEYVDLLSADTWRSTTGTPPSAARRR
jgi:hypothetical protein